MNINKLISSSLIQSLLDGPFIYTGINPTSTTLTIPPEQDPNSIFLNTTLPTTTRKRKGSNQINSVENRRASTADPSNPSTTKRGRHRTKNLPPTLTPGDMEWAPKVEKRPPKSTTKKSKPPLPPPPPPLPLPTITTSNPSATTSILNTLLQLPSNQPKQRPTDTNLLKPIHQPPSFINTILSSNNTFL